MGSSSAEFSLFLGFGEQTVAKYEAGTLPDELHSNTMRMASTKEGAAGLFGLAAGCAGLIYHLASLETFGVPYLAPFTAGAGQPRGHPNLLRPPLPRMKWRDGARHTENRRNQR